MKSCPLCGSTHGHCPECGREYQFSQLHKAKAKCFNTACQKVNAPIDCECGLVVEHEAKGILDLEGEFHKFVNA